MRPEVHWNFLDDQMLAWRQKVVPQGQLLAELVAIREMVEPEAAALAAQNADAQTIAAMREALDAMGIADGNRTPATQDADVRFHRLLLPVAQVFLNGGTGHLSNGTVEVHLHAAEPPSSRTDIQLQHVLSSR